MYKVILVETHGHSIVEGTEIHCHAVFNASVISDFVAVFLLDEFGRVKMSRIDDRHYRPVPGHPTHHIMGA